MSKPEIELLYFPLPGRAGAIRAVLALGGFPYTDTRITFPDFMKMKPELPMGALPIMKLKIDGKETTLTQSDAMLHYVASLTGFNVGSDALEQFHVNEIMGMVEDWGGKAGATMQLPEEEKKKAREALAEKYLAMVASAFESKLSANQAKNPGSPFFVGSSMSIADLKAFFMFRMWVVNMMDYIDTNGAITDKPCIQAFLAAMNADPKLKEHLAAAYPKKD